MNEHVSDYDSPRVALVSGSLNLGGSTTFLCNFAGELVRRKVPVEVFSFERQNPLASDFAALNIPVTCLDQRSSIFEDRLQILLEQLKRFDPTAVLATLSPVSFEVLRYLPAGVLRVGVGQSDDPNVYAMMRHYGAHLDLLAVVSQTMKRKAEAMPEFSRVPVACLPYGVPFVQDGQMRARDFAGRLKILYLGRLDREQKRVHLFPAIFNQLRASGMAFHWTMAGDGSEKAALEQAMKSTRPDQTVSLPGQIAYADVLPLLLEHDIFLLASDYEGLPLSLLEAMGCGLVPVVSDLPSGIPEVVDDTTGKRIPPEEIEAYADAILWLHEHRVDMARLSQNARERVRRDFSIGAMTDRWLNVLQKQPTRKVVWQQRWKIQPPLVCRFPISIYFSPPVRMVRRLAARLR
jgi:glycosyltransferase involved in cell wall biosynthesis